MADLAPLYLPLRIVNNKIRIVLRHLKCGNTGTWTYRGLVPDFPVRILHSLPCKLISLSVINVKAPTVQGRIGTGYLFRITLE
jgi:hypothetical protein